LQLLSKLLKQSDLALLKVSPLLDINLALNQLEKVSRIHIISIDNDCKELLFEITGKKTEEPELLAIHFARNSIQKFRFTRKEDAVAKPNI